MVIVICLPIAAVVNQQGTTWSKSECSPEDACYDVQVDGPCYETHDIIQNIEDQGEFCFFLNKSLLSFHQFLSADLALYDIDGVSTSILTVGRLAQTLLVPVGPVHLNSRASVDQRENSLCIYLWI